MAAIFRAPNDQLLGKYGVVLEFFKVVADGMEIFETFCTFVQAYWSYEEVDAEYFHTKLIAILPKKGDLWNPKK